MEIISHHNSLENARNAALAWLHERGVQFGPHREIAIGRLGVMKGSEVGVMASESHDGPFWRLRLDYDPAKGPHYNAEFGKKGTGEKHAFLFPGDAALLARIAGKRSPR